MALLLKATKNLKKQYQSYKATIIKSMQHWNNTTQTDQQIRIESQGKVLYLLNLLTENPFKETFTLQQKKNQLKMDHRPKCEGYNYKASRRKHKGIVHNFEIEKERSLRT